MGRCPYHELPNWLQLSYFVDRLGTCDKMMLDMAAGQSLKSMPEKEMFMMIEHLIGNLSINPYSHLVVCLFYNGPHEAIQCPTINQRSNSVVTNQEWNHQQETPRQETAAISSTISTVPTPKKENDFEKSIKSLEEKWEEKF